MSGTIKKKLLRDRGQQQIKLTDEEFSYARDLNYALQMHTFKQRLLMGYLTFVIKHHLPDYKLPLGTALEYELDLMDGSNQILIVKEVAAKED